MNLEIGKIKIKSANFNGESSLPSLAFLDNVQQVKNSLLDENDGLYVGYGFLTGIFPYKMQDKYDRSSDEKEYTSITLENKYLKAVFLPELGGRLWSLYDKEKNRFTFYLKKIKQKEKVSYLWYYIYNIQGELLYGYKNYFE